MSVIHISKRENPYVQIDKRVLEDPRLTWRSKGILAYLLSKPSGWKVNVKDIWNNGAEGRNAVQDCLVELQKIGYAKLITIPGEQGKLMGSQWQVTEEPIGGFPVNAERPKTGSPTNRKSGSRVHSNNESLSEINNNNEGERTTPAPNPSTSKEEKKENGLVAPGGAAEIGRSPNLDLKYWPGRGFISPELFSELEALETQTTPLPKVAPKGIPPAGKWEPSDFDILDTGCLEDMFEDEAREAQKNHTANFEATAIASPTDLPGVTLVEAAPGFAEFEQDAVNENLEVWAKIAPFPRVATTIEAEPPQPKKKPAPSAPAPHEENQEVFSYFDNAEKISTAWRKWITEKWGQHKCKFKTVESEKIALRQLWTLSGGKADLADQIIDQSIANTWKGLFALKIQNNGTKPTIADRRRDATANMLRHVAEFGLG